MTRIAIVLVVALGCQRQSDLFCERNPGMCTDGSTEGGMKCGMCIAPLSACDMDTNMCVACNTSLDCDGTKPVCDNHDCRACKVHTECPSGACLPDGSCAGVGTVAFVDETGTDNAACSATMPCATVMAAIATAQPNIKITGTINEHVGIDSLTRVIVGAPNARLTLGSSMGSILDIAGTSMITVGHLTIGGAATMNVGVTLNGGILTLDHVTIDSCINGAINVSSGKLILHQSTVSNNTNSGVTINGGAATFDISNNFIFRNGQTSTGSVGGIGALVFANDGTNKLEFNTIVDNHIATSATHAGGVTCDTSGVSTANNIIARNDVNGDRGASNANVLGVCNFLTSYIDQNILPLKFVDADTSPFDYHIQAGSMAIDNGTTTTTINYDFDGNHRPVGTADDQGANEVQ
jgi:hypothetical protein